jgi:hypothetical protein
MKAETVVQISAALCTAALINIYNIQVITLQFSTGLLYCTVHNVSQFYSRKFTMPEVEAHVKKSRNKSAKSCESLLSNACLGYSFAWISEESMMR